MRKLGSIWLVFFALAALLALLALTVACGEEEEAGQETATPGATPAAAATGTPTPAASPVAFGPGVTDSEIILGMHATLSGTTGAVYKMVTDSLLTYIEYANEELGGACGRKIRIIRYDDGGDYSKALEVTRKLVEEDGVLAVVACLGPHDAVAEYLNENGVPDLMIFSFAEKFSDPEKYPWITVSVGSWYLEGRNFALYIKENYPGKKVGILYVNNESGRDQLKGLQDFLDPSNPLVEAQSFEETAVDVRSQMLKLKDAGAEVLVLTTTIPFTAQALKQAHRMDWKPDGLLLEYGNTDALLFQYVTPELVEGAIAFHAFKMPDWTDDPAVAEHHRIMQEYGGPAPSIFTILMQVVGEVLIETLDRTCDDLTREGVMEAQLSFHGEWCPSLLYPGTCIDTSPTDHRVISEGIMSQVVLEDGQPTWKELGRVMDFEFEEE